ncbi:hypothetical protein GF314_06920 [bacterium]|jgi:hypothetical protein|nr:hypothetical protein [bacterium]
MARSPYTYEKRQKELAKKKKKEEKRARRQERKENEPESKGPEIAQVNEFGEVIEPEPGPEADDEADDEANATA